MVADVENGERQKEQEAWGAPAKCWKTAILLWTSPKADPEVQIWMWDIMMYKKYTFGHSNDQSVFLISFWSSPWFLAHRSPKSWNFLSDKSNGSIFCYSIWSPVFRSRGFLHSSVGKESACNAGDLGSIPGLGRSPGERKGYPFQYSGLENSTDCYVHWVVKSQTWLTTFTFTSGPEIAWEPQSWNGCHTIHNKHLSSKMEFILITWLLEST